jgi:hypothetical protein
VPQFELAARRQEFDAAAFYTVWYNFMKQHKTLKGSSPAMAAGLDDRLWSMTDLANMIDARLPKPAKRGPYKKQIAA